MSFRNRKISKTSADNIATAIVKDRYSDGLDEAKALYETAIETLETAVETLAYTMPARDAWLALTEEQREAVDCRRTHTHRWTYHTHIHVLHEVANFTHSLNLEGFQVLSRSIAEDTVSFFTDDWKKWDFQGQIEAAVATIPEYVAWLAAAEAFDKTRTDYWKICRELQAEMIGRNTKTVIEAWPEAAPFIHEQYGHTVSSSTATTITQPMDTVIANALTPAITLVAE
jgi:hypothetical protein